MDKNKPVFFTPAGGMNQDDSVITPTRDTAGRSLFTLGDYRYALNSRIGSSRGNNFGDIENIKSTAQVENYFARQQWINSNFDFNGTLSGWDVYDPGSGLNFIFSSLSGDDGAYVQLSGVYETDVLYQSEPIEQGDAIILSYTARRSGVVSNQALIIGIYVVFMQDGVEVASELIDNMNLYSASVGEISFSTSTSSPVNCNGIGFKIKNNISHPAVNYLISSFKIIHAPFVQTTPPGGTNKIIGKFEDKEFMRIYYCNWNSNNNDTFGYYDYITDTVYELIRNDFNWESTSFVKMSKLDKWLALTDRDNDPRLINSDTIADLFDELGDDFREFHISYHKWAPVGAPIVRQYYDNITNNIEKLKDKMWQFSFRYIYKGNLKSRWSPVSVAAECPSESSTVWRITAIEVLIPGLFLDENGNSVEYNYFNNEDIKAITAIDKIQIAYRENSIGIWKLWKTIDPTTEAQRFTGSVDATPIATDDFIQPFDTVPLKAGTVEAIDNRFVFGDILDEHEPAQTPVITNVGVFQNQISGLIDWNSAEASAFSGVASSDDRNEIANRNRVTQRTFKTRGIYKLGMVYKDKKGWTSLAYTAENWIYEIPDISVFAPNSVPPRSALTFAFDDSFKPPEWAVAYQIVRTNALNIDSFLYGTCNEIVPIIDDLTNAINTLENAPESLRNKINEHFLNSRLITGRDFDAYLDDLTKHTVFYSAGRELRRTKTTTLVQSASRLYININNWYNASKKDATGNVDNPMNNLYYNYRPGDKVKFVASTVANPLDNQKAIFTATILEFTGNALIIERPSDVMWVPQKSSSNAFGRNFFIEVYTEKEPKEEDFIYYESGEWYPVLYPGTDDRDWSKKDWNYTSVSSITASTYGDYKVFNKHPFYFGDCVYYERVFYNDLRSFSPSAGTAYVASMSPDRKTPFARWEKANGRAFTAYEELPVSRFKPTTARFSGKVVEESLVNNINRMRAEDQRVYPSEYGRIRELVNTANAQVESAGAILLAIGEREAWSIYVNRATLEDLSGRTQVTLSDQVLGSYNKLLGSHGTLNPESVSHERGNVYWWDALDGSWVRYGRNGLTPISSYKMRTWFREIAALLRTKYLSNEVPRVISEYDSFNEELVTFIDHSELPATFRGYPNYKGVLFSEEDTRWKSVHNYNPEFFSKIGTQLIAFKDGLVYKMESGEDYGSFFGTKYDVMIEPVFNENSMDVKHWQTISYITTDKWSVERILSEYRGLKSFIESRIPMESFESREDTYWAALKRNLNSPNVSNPIIDGEAVRCKAIQVLMKLDPTITHLSLMHYIFASYTDSPKNA